MLEMSNSRIKVVENKDWNIRGLKGRVSTILWGDYITKNVDNWTQNNAYQHHGDVIYVFSGIPNQGYLKDKIITNNTAKSTLDSNLTLFCSRARLIIVPPGNFFCFDFVEYLTGFLYTLTWKLQEILNHFFSCFNRSSNIRPKHPFKKKTFWHYWFTNIFREVWFTFLYY